MDSKKINTVWIVCLVILFSDTESKNTTKAIIDKGYLAEIHRVVTHDKYVLEMNRIPCSRWQFECPINRPVVFLMHGLFAASNSFISLDPEYSIAYNLADAGFDVWMGNARGTRDSRRHVTLDPDRDHKKFFDFTFEEIALADLPSMLDYILYHTKRSSLHYVGHSQGGTVFLILNSMMPQYNSKVASAHILAGVGYQKNFPHKQLEATARMTNPYYRTAKALGLVEIFPKETLIRNRRTNVAKCFGNSLFDKYCDKFGVTDVLNPILHQKPDFELGGAATKQLAHYGQNVKEKRFSRWDYGKLQNLKIYGNVTPPEYNLRKVTTRTTMYYSTDDSVLGEADVLAMVEVMENARARKISGARFLHTDYIFSERVKYLVTDYIINDIKFGR